VENSLDASATDIHVEIREGGRRLIRVADNGWGIAAEEMHLAFARHATSKLGEISDLDRITTLGFRGEALPSITAVSQVTLVSRPRQQSMGQMGQMVRMSGGEVQNQEARGCPAGTDVTVEHLFRNVPARLKFLKTPQTEAGHIHSVVSHYAMAFPHVRMSLHIDGRASFQTSGNGEVHDVLIALYGLEMADQLVPLDSEAASQAGLSVSGHVGLPALHRATRSYISLFVNRRWIQDRSIAHAVTQAYHTLLPVGRYPLAVIFVELDASEVDVNVHPTKREVRFRDGRRVFSAVQRAVRQTLIARTPVPTADGTRQTWPTPDWERRERLISVDGGPTSRSQLDMEFYRSEEGLAGLAVERAGELEPVGPVRLPLLRVIGQVGQTYVVAEGPQGMYLVDQHAAHERVLFEQMLTAYQEQAVSSQTMLEPLTFEPGPMLEGALAGYLPALLALGFDLQPFGGTSYLLRAVPALLSTPDVRTALSDILEILQQGDDPLSARIEEKVAAAVCKRAAVKAGQTLAHEEMQLLIRQLEQCESPRTCPHGRPTVIHFSVAQLEKEFGRR
jgi:DNA mismatch repair protein MutL